MVEAKTELLPLLHEVRDLLVQLLEKHKGGRPRMAPVAPEVAVVETLRKAGGTCIHSNLMRRTNLPAEVFFATLQKLQTEGVIQTSLEPTGGRPRIVYTLTEAPSPPS